MTEHTTERGAYVSGLRKMADWLEAHPDVQLPVAGRLLPFDFNFWGGDAREQLGKVARLFPGKLEKTVDDSYFRLSGSLDGLRIVFTGYREAVCVKRVVGTETVTAMVPPYDVELVEVTTEREIVEWECPPLLAEVSET